MLPVSPHTRPPMYQNDAVDKKENEEKKQFRAKGELQIVIKH